MAARTAIGLLEIITAALTPVVMISAAASLILGTNQKHAALADRIRELATEFRASDTSEERRELIRAQMPLFARRIACARLAHLWLYAAVVCFVGMILAITLGPRGGLGGTGTLVLFVVGIVLLLGAVLEELIELQLGDRTIRMEIDAVAPANSRSAVPLNRAKPAPGRSGDKPPYNRS
jgi:hypothetical protein